ncbi:hypothetical protein PtA15_2A710 [Puccinia triticina]|uniref:PX domain-containing protein n=1 Tax=Puccinia triticina TaxID=208348 RepID=A0ABY7CDF1_9BASI|nr:uncharacterized protein PtA15_2A710 [Puccinia triticina]WAQ82393.1 hypothetical protein PtA15_2A710 [Puccinia triticina]WAR53247.1 hypothetical protein PtB15_2B678 [Puccinia triticina]
MSFYPSENTGLESIEDDNPFADLPSKNKLGFDGKPLIIPDLASFTSSAVETSRIDEDYQTSPDQQLFKFNNDQLESSYQQPFQDFISPSSSNQFNYQSEHSSPSHPTEPAEQPAPPQGHPVLDHHQTIRSEPPPEPPRPLFRPFGVSATLTSSSPTTDHLDHPISPSNPTPNSRPALPDILGGGSLSGSLLLPDARASLPAFKKSSPKLSRIVQKIDSDQYPTGSNPSSQPPTQAKPYRPLGLKIPQPKPIIINPQPAPATTEPVQNQKIVEPQSNQSTRSTSPPTPKHENFEPARPTTSAAVEPSFDRSNVNNPDPQPAQKDAAKNAVEDAAKDAVKDVATDVANDTAKEEEENANEVASPTCPTGDLSASQEVKTGLSIRVPPPSSSLPSLVPTSADGDHPQATQPDQRRGQQDGESQDPAGEQSGPDPSAGAPPQAVQTDASAPEHKPAHPPDTDSEDERPLASVREGLATDPNSSGPLKASSTVLRRFRDFVWLFDALVSNNPGIIVPPIPDKNLRHRFQEGFIAARRVALEFFLQKTVNHPMLTSDPDLKLFLESDAFGLEIKHRKHDSTHQTGWLANIAGPRFVETDEFFENRKIALDTLEGQLKVLQASLTAASKARRVMAQSLSELAEGLQVLSTSDLSKPVRNTIDRLAGLHRQAHQWALDQATNELESLITTVEAYARLTNSVRLTFGGRVKSWDKLQYAINHLKKIQANHEKIKRSCSPNDQSTALMYSLAELEEAERRAHDARNEFADVSKLIKAEFQRFDQEKVEDFKLSICTFVDGLTDRQRQIVKVWQEYYQVLQVLSKQNADATIPVQPAPMTTSPVVPQAPEEPHHSSATLEPASSPVDDPAREPDLDRDHHASLSPSDSQHQQQHEHQPLVVPDDAAVWADVSQSSPSPLSSSS